MPCEFPHKPRPKANTNHVFLLASALFGSDKLTKIGFLVQLQVETCFSEVTTYILSGRHRKPEPCLDRSGGWLINLSLKRSQHQAETKIEDGRSPNS